MPLLTRIAWLVSHYRTVAEESANPELFALVHDLDDAFTDELQHIVAASR